MILGDNFLLRKMISKLLYKRTEWDWHLATTELTKYLPRLTLNKPESKHNTAKVI